MEVLRSRLLLRRGAGLGNEFLIGGVGTGALSPCQPPPCGALGLLGWQKGPLGSPFARAGAVLCPVTLCHRTCTVSSCIGCLLHPGAPSIILLGAGSWQDLTLMLLRGLSLGGLSLGGLWVGGSAPKVGSSQAGPWLGHGAPGVRDGARSSPVTCGRPAWSRSGSPPLCPAEQSRVLGPAQPPRVGSAPRCHRMPGGCGICRAADEVHGPHGGSSAGDGFCPLQRWLQRAGDTRWGGAEETPPGVSAWSRGC